MLVGIVNSSTALGRQGHGRRGQEGAGHFQRRRERHHRRGPQPVHLADVVHQLPGLGRRWASIWPAPGKTAYAIAPDYAAGAEAIAGFSNAFKAGGGTVVGEGKPAFGKTQDYQPFLSRIQASGRAGDLLLLRRRRGGRRSSSSTPSSAWRRGSRCTAPGFLTEGGVLAAQGDAARRRADHAALHDRAGQRRPTRTSARRTRPSTTPRRRCTPCRPGTRPTCWTGRCAPPPDLARRRAVEGARLRRHDRRQPARRRGASTARRRSRRSTCARSKSAATALVNAVVSDLGVTSQPG